MTKRATVAAAVLALVVAVPVLAHRLILAPEARSTGVSGEQIVQETLDKTPVPV